MWNMCKILYASKEAEIRSVHIKRTPATLAHQQVEVSNTTGAGNGHFCNLQMTANDNRKAVKT